MHKKIRRNSVVSFVLKTKTLLVPTRDKHPNAFKKLRKELIVEEIRKFEDKKNNKWDICLILKFKIRR